MFERGPIDTPAFMPVGTYGSVKGLSPEQVAETGAQILVTQVTFYDPLALVEPQSAVYLHTYSAELEEAGLRVRNWECSTSSNSYKDENGSTMFYLPGDPEYKDPRGYTDFPDLPGQSKDPIFDAQ